MIFVCCALKKRLKGEKKIAEGRGGIGKRAGRLVSKATFAPSELEIAACSSRGGETTWECSVDSRAQLPDS
jgi:hypothetical protein